MDEKNMDTLTDLNLRKSLIKKQGCFLQLTDRETEELADLLTEQSVPKGKTIVMEGEPVDSLYFIVKGKADVRHETIKNHIREYQSVATLGPGDAIGLNETGFYSLSGRRTATVVANEPMLLLYLSVAEFHGFALAHAHVSALMRENAAVFLDIRS
jgi:CRP-like cAMP-binding protein